MTLTDFLLARIAEDEAAARALLECDNMLAVLTSAPCDHAMTYLLKRQPQRMQAECEAKRRIVEDLRELIEYDRDRFIVSPGVEEVATRTMTYLALPYADHPDYREEVEDVTEEFCVGCGEDVDRTLPRPIPEGYECMMSEAMCGRALYCRACYGETD